MKEQNPDSTSAPNLKGGGTTTAGILAILTGGLGLYAQVTSLHAGHPVDPMQLASSIGTVSAGIGLVKAADSKQEPKKKKKSAR